MAGALKPIFNGSGPKTNILLMETIILLMDLHILENFGPSTRFLLNGPGVFLRKKRAICRSLVRVMTRLSRLVPLALYATTRVVSIGRCSSCRAEARKLLCAC